MKRYFIAVTLLCGLFTQAQLSDLHYLPPLKQGNNNDAIREQSVFLSTPETTPFTVNVYQGTDPIPIISFNISNTTPAEYELDDGDNDVTLVDERDTGVVLTQSGLRFESVGSQKFYVNYRGRSASQAASLTAKGRAALGTHFKWGGVPNIGEERSLSNTLGIMATQDNTTVTLSDYDPNCEFTMDGDTSGITDDTYTIVLNANESFVFETYKGTVSSVAQESGWIGADILADKDIVISNGSLNFGREAASETRDAGIDQPVPIEDLGTEFVLIRGNGSAVGNTEFPLIISTQDNTQIFVNGSPTPIATLNDGDYFEVPSSNYASTAAGANMYIQTTAPVYTYQCIAGADRSWTTGINFVAPVSCNLPDTVDNIPDITNMAGITITGGVTLIASASTPDANITVTDGSGVVSLPPSTAVAGTNDWKTFYLPSLSGNVSVTSSGPIALGFFGFNGARGVAGYFSGFDEIEAVDLEVTGSTCLPGASIQVANGETFDSYQWYFNNNPIAGETSQTLAPTVAGTYFLRGTKGPCEYDSNPIGVYYCNPDLVLSKGVKVPTVTEGTNANFLITAENLWENPLTNLTISDLLPQGLEFISATPSVGSFSYPDWTIGTLQPGQKVSLSLIASTKITDITLQSQTYTNTVVSSQDQTDFNITSDNESVDITVTMIQPSSVLMNRRITHRVNRLQ